MKRKKKFHPAKKCSICGMPYVENHMLSESLIKILGDKIRYIPSCKCHETFYERELEKIERANEKERVKNRGNRYKNFSIIDNKFLNSLFEKADFTEKHMEIAKKYAEKFIEKNCDVGILFYGNSGTENFCICLYRKLSYGEREKCYSFKYRSLPYRT